MEVDDGDFLGGLVSPTCALCRHWLVGTRTCLAYPDGIPDEVWSGRNDHREPYPGDNGIQFARVPYPDAPEGK